MEKHHESDYALELLSRRVSDPFHVLAESPQDAAEQFQESLQFEAFLSRNVGKSVFIYYDDDAGRLMPVR
jgi:hypothetical protein